MTSSATPTNASPAWQRSPLLRLLRVLVGQARVALGAWLQPPACVALQQTSGGPVRLYRLDGRPLLGWRASRWALLGVRRWPARAVPESCVLRRQWWQPSASASATAAAAQLRAQTESPFPPEDTIFVWHARPDAQRGGCTVHGVWLSRRLLAQQGLGQDARTLLWVSNPPGGDQWQPVPGLGLQALRRWRLRYMVAAGALWLLVGALAAAAALTPSWHLRQRAHHAQALWNDLLPRAEPALAARHAMVTALQAVQAYDDAVRRLPDAVAVLNWLHDSAPDDTHLTELELDGDTLRIGGFTPNATALLQLWRAQPHVGSIVATRPATKSAANGKESFQFEIKLNATPSAP